MNDESAGGPSAGGDGAGRAIILRQGASAPLSRTVREAIDRGDHLGDFFGGRQTERGARIYCLAVERRALAPAPAYAVALADANGRVVFEDLLVFRPVAADDAGTEPGLVTARPDERSVQALGLVAALLMEQTVCVPDELAPELDGLRDALGLAGRVVSLAPALSRAAHGLHEGPTDHLIRWLETDFDGAAGPGGRTAFMKDAWAWVDWRADRREL